MASGRRTSSTFLTILSRTARSASAYSARRRIRGTRCLIARSGVIHLKRLDLCLAPEAKPFDKLLSTLSTGSRQASTRSATGQAINGERPTQRRPFGATAVIELVRLAKQLEAPHGRRALQKSVGIFADGLEDSRPASRKLFRREVGLKKRHCGRTGPFWPEVAAFKPTAVRSARLSRPAILARRPRNSRCSRPPGRSGSCAGRARPGRPAEWPRQPR